jgi:uncharacterized protein (DUF2164 family)
MMKKIRLPREASTRMKEEIRHYFLQERGEEIGELAADNLLDFMLKELGPFVYNQAVQDARTVLMQKAATMEEDLFALEQRIPPVSRR